MTKEQIITQANEFCKSNNIDNYPVNIVELCKRYGFKVFEEYLPSEVSGFIVAQQDNFRNYGSNKVIVANLADSARRRRFTIAHELAHYMLHKDQSETFYAHRDAGQNGGIETEANIFASSILMPEVLVKQALSELLSPENRMLTNNEKVNYISDLFAVSIPAAKVRLDQLHIL